MKKQTNKVLVSLANMKPCRFSRAVCVGICFCALAFAVRSAHAALCKWSLEEVVVTTGKFSDVEKTALDKLIDELLEAVAPKPPQIGLIKKAIDKVGPGGDVVDVVIIYECRDLAGDTHRWKKELDHTEDVYWAEKMMKKDPDGAKEAQENLIEKYRPKDSCCKPTPTPSPSPSSSPSPTPTPTPSRPRTYTGPAQTPIPTPQEHGMAPKQPGKAGETCAVLIATGKIKVETSGTGETIGHVADLKIQNLTDQPLKCAIAPMILESGSRNNQHYACPSGQIAALNPHQTKTVPVNGVCLNRNKPPVGKGVSGDLVINEANPSGPQNPNSHLPVNQAQDLLRICTAKYSAANQLQKSGALRNLPYKDKQKQKDIVVQWSTWCDPRISQITGAPPATKDDLKKVVYKQVEAKGPMTPETKKKVDQGIDTIFEKVELTTAKAKDLEIPVAGPAIAETPAAGQPEAVSQTAAINPVGAIAQDAVHNTKKDMTAPEFVKWLDGVIGDITKEIEKIDADEKKAKDDKKAWPSTAEEKGKQMRRNVLKKTKQDLQTAKEAATPKTLEMAKTAADTAIADLTIVELGASLAVFAADLLGYKDIPLPKLLSVLKTLKAFAKTEKLKKAIEAAEKAAEAYEKAKEFEDKAKKLQELKEKVDDVKKALKEP